MQSENYTRQTPFETLKPQTHGSEIHVEALEVQLHLDVMLDEIEAGSVGCEMSYRENDHHSAPPKSPKRPTGTVYNWHGAPVIADTPTGRAAPVIVASQQIAAAAPKLSVRPCAFEAVTCFSNLPIAA